MTPRSLLILLIIASACSQDRTAEIDKAMRHYDELILQMDVDDIAQAYGANGMMRGENQNAIVGRDSIRKFLAQFSNFKLFEYRSVSGPTVFHGDTAIQGGTYFQKVKPPGSDTLELGGKYRTTWINDGHEWLIYEMYTHDYENLKKEPGSSR